MMAASNTPEPAHGNASSHYYYYSQEERPLHAAASSSSSVPLQRKRENDAFAESRSSNTHGSSRTRRIHPLYTSSSSSLHPRWLTYAMKGVLMSPLIILAFWSVCLTLFKKQPHRADVLQAVRVPARPRGLATTRQLVGEQQPAMVHREVVYRDAVGTGQAVYRELPSSGESATTYREFPSSGESATTYREFPSSGESATTYREFPSSGESATTYREFPSSGESATTYREFPSSGESATTYREFPSSGESIIREIPLSGATNRVDGRGQNHHHGRGPVQILKSTAEGVVEFVEDALGSNGKARAQAMGTALTDGGSSLLVVNPPPSTTNNGDQRLIVQPVLEASSSSLAMQAPPRGVTTYNAPEMMRGHSRRQNTIYLYYDPAQVTAPGALPDVVYDANTGQAISMRPYGSHANLLVVPPFMGAAQPSWHLPETAQSMNFSIVVASMLVLGLVIGAVLARPMRGSLDAWLGLVNDDDDVPEKRPLAGYHTFATKPSWRSDQLEKFDV
jgi:hypothetical protein